MVTQCPCGGGLYKDCCEPLHDGMRVAQTPEELMRSRYSAYALKRDNYVFATWHPRTRPTDVSCTGIEWARLRIIDTKADQVEFEASYLDDGVPGIMRERSVFVQRAGRWFYLDALSIE